jgi:hypothetical protein
MTATAREPFAEMLRGGHPNSLGRTIEVVEMVSGEPALLTELFACYSDADEVVRLRTSNAMKRLWRTNAAWVVPYIDRFLSEVAAINQPSAQWTLAYLLSELDAHLTPEQRARGQEILRRNLLQTGDWIVTNSTLQALSAWAAHDEALKTWLLPHLQRFAGDKRKSVAGTARKLLAALSDS